MGRGRVVGVSDLQAPHIFVIFLIKTVVSKL